MDYANDDDADQIRTLPEFLHRIDTFIVNSISGFAPDPPYQKTDSHALFREFTYKDTFREQLRKFLESRGLPTNLCSDDDTWMAFLAAYAGVVEDGTLSAAAPKNNAFKAVSKVTFTKGKMPLSADPLFEFIVQWDITLKDGRTCRMGFEPRADGHMLVWELHLIPPPQPQVAAAARAL